MSHATRTALVVTSLLLAAFARAAQAEPAKLSIHFDLSDSVREQMDKAVIRGIRVTASTGKAKPLQLETTGDGVVFEGMSAGKWTITTFLLMDKQTFVVDPPKGVEVEVRDGVRVEKRVPIDALILRGRVTAEGKPFHGQMNLWPSESNRDAWGFAVAFDSEGRFVFPLPRAGKWDLRLTSRDRKFSTTLYDYELRALDTQHDLDVRVPETIVRGRIVDVEGKGLTGVRVHATLEREGSRPVRESVVSGEDGAFTFASLAGGTWSIKASNGDAKSEPLQLELANDAREEGLVLQLK